MYLTNEEEAILAGSEGEAKAFAMKVLVNLGDLESSEGFYPIVSAHVSGVSYHTAGEALIRLLEELNRMGAKVTVPTSLNPAGMDLELWESIGYPPDFAKKQFMIIELYSKLGIDITCSCIPYETPQSVQSVRMGDHLAWSESNAVIYANSMVGARTNRESGVSALASAILGKTPVWGMHLDGPRMPSMEVTIDGSMKAHHFDLLGAYIGKHFNSIIPVYKGIKKDVSRGSLKHLGAAMAAKGGHAIFHILDMTPERDLVQKAYTDKHIVERITLTPEELDDLKDGLYPAPAKDIDIFVLGCPQFGISEFDRLSGALKGRKLKMGKRIIVYTNRSILGAMEEHERGVLIDAGIEIYNDTCMVVTPLRSIGIERVGTDSGKAAHYIPRMSGVETGLLPLEMIVELCVE
ncbi:MAG: aconitase X catalytic domain-containing protein [Candidatus Thermoplasmatota archaeon]|nr:aconitase X catalytic domain-containing protein [Candidatus Thermoplasmatota archaeon]